MEKWDAVIVTWLDASSEYNAMNSVSYVRSYKPAVRRTIGFLLTDDRENIHVAMDDDRDSIDQTTDCQTVTTIPKAMVKDVTVLKKVRPVKARR